MKTLCKLLLLSVAMIAMSCAEKEKYVTLTVGGPHLFIQGTRSVGLSINALPHQTDSWTTNETVKVKVADFVLKVQPRTGMSVEAIVDRTLEDNIYNFYLEKHPTSEITVPESSLPLEGGSPYPPVSITYTSHNVSEVSIVSDTELFGIAVGKDLTKCFNLVDVETESDHEYCMIYSDKSVTDYHEGLTVEEYLALKPAFAGAVCYKLLPEYAAKIDKNTLCRFKVTVTLNDGTKVEQETAQYELGNF